MARPGAPGSPRQRRVVITDHDPQRDEIVIGEASADDLGESMPLSMHHTPSQTLADALGDQSQKGENSPLLKFDFEPSRFCPRRLPVEALDDEQRMVRKELWAKYGLAMHFLTLEFEDYEVELEYIKDGTRRNKRWVEYGVFLRAMVQVLFVSQKVVTCYLNGCDDLNKWYWIGFPTVGGVLYLLQYCQLRFDTDFVHRQFQHVIFFWAMLQALSIILFVWLSVPFTFDEEKCMDRNAVFTTEQVKHIMAVGSTVVESMTIFVLVVLIVYRMRFLYFLYTNVVLMLGYFMFVARTNSLYHNPHCKPFTLHMRHVAVVCPSLVLLSYVISILQRKDFIQALMVHKESRNSELLLNNALPAQVVAQLKSTGGHGFAQSYVGVTVLFADVVSFTTMSARVTPEQLVELLNRMFLKFDDLAEKNGVEKVKTIGDCYMGAAGVPDVNPSHAKTMARFGLQMLEAMEAGGFRNPATDEALRVRVGIHSGPCVAGVIGHTKFAYDVWGDAVNTASRMESHGEPMKLHCSSDTYVQLKDDFVCEEREKMYVKGKGEMQTYFVISEMDAAKSKSFVTADFKSFATGWTTAYLEEEDGDDADEPSPNGPQPNANATGKRGSVGPLLKGFSRRVSSLGLEGGQSPAQRLSVASQRQSVRSQDGQGMQIELVQNKYRNRLSNSVR